jgi:16S rRNA G966 N2-methylase RsmD
MNIIKKIYPNISEDKLKELKYDEEGLYSITLPEEAKIISSLLVKSLKKEAKKSIIFDGTAGLGGNTLSFCNYFKNVISCEINKSRYDILKKNIELYKYNNIVINNINCIEYIKNNNSSDVYFFDPPWGGPDYKFKTNISLKLSNMSLINIVKLIKNKNNNAIICFKLPFNYNFNEFENMKYYKKKIKNMIILLIYSVIK